MTAQVVMIILFICVPLTLYATRQDLSNIIIIISQYVEGRIIYWLNMGDGLGPTRGARSDTNLEIPVRANGLMDDVLLRNSNIWCPHSEYFCPVYEWESCDDVKVLKVLGTGRVR